MEETKLSSYEAYLLADEKDEVFSTMVEGSDTYKYLKCLDLLHFKGLNLSEEEKAFIENYTKNHAKSKKKNEEEIWLRYTLLQFDKKEDSVEKKKVLDEINKDLLHLKFKYNRPAHMKKGEDGSSSGGTDSEEEKGRLSDTLSSKLVTPQYYLDKFQIEGDEQIFNITGRQMLDLNSCKPEFFQIIVDDALQLGGAAKYENEESFYQLAARFAQQKKEEGILNYPFQEEFFRCITITQLEKFLQMFPPKKNEKHLYFYLIDKKFHKELTKSHHNSLSVQEKRENLIKIYEFIHSYSHFENLESCYLIEILYNGILLNHYEEKYFIKYIAKITTKKAFDEDYVEQNYDWREFLSGILNPHSYDSDFSFAKSIIKQYLAHFFSKGKKVADYLKYLDLTFLKYHFNKSLLYSGQKIDISASSEELEMFSSKVSIKIPFYNKQKFEIEEEVKLDLILKNVPTLIIKLFDINIENYYKQSLNELETDINLDGLAPSEEEIHEFKQIPPQKKFLKNFSFPSLTNKTGLFIIEFIGNGKSSRAIIQKGELYLVERPTIAGHVCYILDMKKEICNSDKTGIFVNNKYYPADQEKEGRIIIPYSKINQKCQAILIHQGLSQLTSLRILEEDYQLKCNFIVFHETFLMGNNAKILVKPQLFLNNRKATLSLLEKTKCTITTRDYVDQIPSIKTFENIKFAENDRSFEIQFQVPAHLDSFEIEFTGNIKNATVNHVSNKKRVQIRCRDKNIGSFFLQQKGEDFLLYLLGKNGEAVRKCSVKLTLTLSFLCDVVEEHLRTNKDGFINMGDLKYIRRFKASTSLSQNEREICQTFHTPLKQLEIPEREIHITSKTTLQLHCSAKEISPDTVQLLQYLKKPNPSSVLSNTLIQSLPSKLSISTHVHSSNSLSSLNTLIIQPLSPGFYSLTLNNHNLHFENTNKTQLLNIPITVHDGQMCLDQLFILKQNSIVEINQITNPVSIKQVTYKKKDNQSEVVLSLDGQRNDIRVHAFAYQFLEDSSLYDLESISQMFPNNQKIHKFNTPENVYLSNRELSDEYRYVLDRKYLPKTVGTNLEKPSLLLKRNFIENTEVDEIEEKKGADYAQKQYRGGKYDEEREDDDEAEGEFYIDIREEEINMLQNFLLHPPLVYFDLIPDEKNEVRFTANLENYSSMHFYAEDSESITKLMVPIPSETRKDVILKRDLCLRECLDCEANLCEIRNAIPLEKHDNYVIDDITSTNMQIIDSVDKAYRILHQRVKESDDNQALDALNKFQFITHWNAIKVDLKHKKFSQLFSHELNMFIYKKDYQYFKQIVEPFLQSKMEKTFIDYYLLQDKEELLSYYHNQKKFDELNIFEKVLLLQFLVPEHKKLAEVILHHIKEENEFRKGSVSEQNTIFDTVLNMNILKGEDEKEDFEKMMALEIEEKKVEKEKVQVYKDEDEEDFDDEDDEEDYGEDEGEGGGGGGGEGYGRKKRNIFNQKDFKKKRQLHKNIFEEMEETKEYGETHYYELRDLSESKQRTCVNQFWEDYAQYLIANYDTQEKERKPFLSHNFIYCIHSITEVLAALSLLDLSFSSVEHGFKSSEGRSAEIKAASNLILFRKEIKESKAEIQNDILVAIKYFDLHQLKHNLPKKVEEFLVNEIYGCEVLITNVSAEQQNFQVLVQIPEGSLPLENSPYQKSHSFSLGSYTTSKRLFYFYFPSRGMFKQFPATASINSCIVAKSPPTLLKVVQTKTILSDQNFADILQSNSDSRILEFISTKNLQKKELDFKFSLILHLLRNRTFFTSLIKILTQRHIFSHEVFAFSLYHLDIQTMKIYFANTKSLSNVLGSSFSNSFINLKDNLQSFRDYYPLISPRAHPFGGSGAASTRGTLAHEDSARVQIRNKNFRNTYANFLIAVIRNGGEMNDVQNMMFVCYLLFQDKVTQAQNVFQKVNPARLNQQTGGTIQFDYITAFFDMCDQKHQFKKARVISEKYLQYPVVAWRILFLDIHEQLREFDGIEEEKGEETKKKLKKKAIRSEVTLELKLENKDLHVTFKNLDKICIKYYEIDLEILFSRSPFLMQNTEYFNFVKPNKIENYDVAKSETPDKQIFTIAEEFEEKNVMVEVTGEGKNAFASYFSTNLKLEISENFGEIKVLNDKNVPQPKVYVKVFAKLYSNETSFFKDGYTDIRGIFDYLSLNTSNINKVQTFALFVMSEKHGSLIKECKPPASIGKKKDQSFGVLKKMRKYRQYYGGEGGEEEEEE